VEQRLSLPSCSRHYCSSRSRASCSWARCAWPLPASEQRRTSRPGALHLAADAANVAREYFARELELSAPLLDGAAEDIAAAADVAAYPSAPAYDARTGARYDRPTVRIAADVPVRSPIFGALVLRPVTVLHVIAVSSPR